MRIELRGQSNFVVTFAMDSNASERAVAARTREVSADLKTNLLVIGRFCSKVFGLNTNYPTIFGGVSRELVVVHQPTLEIWAARAMLAYGVYSWIRNTGIL
jgi:hypothetical protein